MTQRKTKQLFWVLGMLALAAVLVWPSAPLSPAESAPATAAANSNQQEVVFWHFWGGKEGAVVNDIVARFNASQTVYRVKAVAMPGSNLDVKFFLSLAGKEPPDLLNQDDPVVGDWAARGAITPLAQVASSSEIQELDSWLFPPAKELGSYRGELYALCNGLDVRALYCNLDLLKEEGLAPPHTLEELTAAAHALTKQDPQGHVTRFGYLPDPRRFWAWGVVHGGSFYDAASGQPTLNSPHIEQALSWMRSFGERYGYEQVAAFRKGDQAVTGSAFPLLQGRYAIIEDGQWRVTELEQAGERALPFAVVPYPPPTGGRANAGWVNGNFFVIPTGARQPAGAWAFMKFWSGFGGHAAEAARVCTRGGWIPASPTVANEPIFKAYLAEHPAFAQFVRLAQSPYQRPTPVIPGASFFYTEVVRAAEDAMYRGADVHERLSSAQQSVSARLAEIAAEHPAQSKESP